jgi:hypothetical protein
MSDWVPVGESLPELRRPVIICCEDGFVGVGIRHGKGWMRGSEEATVTHWMPLPDAPIVPCSSKLIQVLEVIEKRASPGPWVVGDSGIIKRAAFPAIEFCWSPGGGAYAPWMRRKDAYLIAAMRNTFPSLLTELRRRGENGSE